MDPTLEAITLILWTYFTYLLLGLGLSIWVGQALYRHGRVFLDQAFHGNEELAKSVNHLFVVGLCLVNIGFVALALKTNERPFLPPEALELLSTKLGRVLLMLGATHFLSLYIYSRIRKHQ